MKNTLMLCAAVALALPACKFLAKQLIDYTETWSSGLPKSKGTLASGEQAGDWVFYYESGKPRAKGAYQKDRQIGPWVFYYENGVVERAGPYDDTGKRTGEWTFNHPDQTPAARGSYRGDFEDGPWLFYGTDGALERSGQFDEGLLSGPWRYFYAGGRPRAEGMYHRGQRIGAWKITSETGQASLQDFGTRPGIEIVREQWPNGTIRRTGVLENGAPVGRWTSFHEDGQPRFCCTLNGAAASGVFVAYDGGGNVVAQGVLAAGQFAAPGIAVEAGKTRPLASGPVPPAASSAQPWCVAKELASLAPEVAVGTLLAELSTPFDRTAVVARVEIPMAPPPPAVATVVRKIDDDATRMPAPMQPDLSVKQKKEMKAYVAEYTDGPKKSGSVLQSYKPDTSRPQPRGTGRRAEMEGKPMPFQKMRGVDGSEVDLATFRGQKRVMVVVLRGFLGEVCCYCVAQTKALSQSREQLEQLGVEVLVLYPGPKENEQSFEQAYRMTFNEGAPPYRVFYDPDLELVTQLGIAGDLASPSTIVIDEQGLVQFFYVGEHKADRPAANKLIEVIKGMKS